MPKKDTELLEPFLKDEERSEAKFEIVLPKPTSKLNPVEVEKNFREAIYNLKWAMIQTNTPPPSSKLKFWRSSTDHVKEYVKVKVVNAYKNYVQTKSQYDALSDNTLSSHDRLIISYLEKELTSAAQEFEEKLKNTEHKATATAVAFSLIRR
jgi:hypothetical protein